MPTTVQFRRANTLNTSGFTGANAELTVDTDKHVVVVHDGATTGGFPLVPELNPHLRGTATVGNSSATGNVEVSGIVSVGNTVTNVVVNSISVAIGTDVLVNTSVLQVGTSKINATSLYVSSNLAVGNTSVNTKITTSSVSVGTVVLSNVDLTLGSSYINSTSIVAQTHFANTALKLGNSTINAVINSTSLTLTDGTTSTGIPLPTNTEYAGVYGLIANGSWYELSGLSGNTLAAGANTQVQFNNSTSFGATSDFTYDYSTKELVIGNTEINQTSLYFSNGTTNTAISLPTSIEYATVNKFLHANGSWVTPVLGANGEDKAIQYSNGGIIAGNSLFTYNYSTSKAIIGNTTTGTSVNTSSIVVGNATVNVSISSTNVSANVVKVASNTGLILGSSSATANGYTWLPNGFLFQWGKVTTSSGKGNITFPVKFPTQVFSVSITPMDPGPGDIDDYAIFLYAANTTTANVRTYATPTTTVYYLAIGL